jgi:serine/threonine-protein kinase
MLEPGDVLAGKYRVERVLGKGGMGYVVAAIHTQLEERVAVKFLMPELCVQEEPVTRFLREARAAVRIRSEHVARVLDVGVLDDGAPYMVMEYLDGYDLSAELDRRMQLSVADAVDYILQASEAIAEAHARGIVHRDLKPANLFLTSRADGSPLVKVLDFGISKAVAPDSEPVASLTATQSLLGSPHYMSPEQVRKPKTVDVRTDIWSLGVILYEMLTGSLPFTAENAMSVLAAVVSDPTPRIRDTRPDVPEDLDAVVTRCLSKEAAQRFQNVAEFAEALAPFAPPSAVPSIKRIAGVLRTSGEGSNPPEASPRHSKAPAGREGGEQPTLVSESDPGPAPPRDRAVSTDPTLVADWAPRAEARAAAQHSGETASQWEHLKEPFERKARPRRGAVLIGLGVVGTLAISGYVFSRFSAPTPTAEGADANSGAVALPPSAESPSTARSAASLEKERPATDTRLDSAAQASETDAAAGAPDNTSARMDSAPKPEPAVRPPEARAASKPRPTHSRASSATADAGAAARSVDPLEGRR